jgi:hypothetical protein
MPKKDLDPLIGSTFPGVDVKIASFGDFESFSVEKIGVVKQPDSIELYKINLLNKSLSMNVF